MKFYVFSLVLVSSIYIINLYGQNKSNIKVPAFNDKYCEYVKRLENGDTTIDFQDFRFSFIDSEQFPIAFNQMTEIDGIKKEIRKKYNEKKYEEVIALCEQILSIDYTDLDAHTYIGFTYKKLNNMEMYEKHKVILFKLVDSILQSGDGKTCKTGWKVIKVSEEYYILNLFEATFQKQSLVSNKDELCDKMDVLIDGKERTFYFDVNRVFDGYDRVFKK